jgi:hypothetical protein
MLEAGDRCSTARKSRDFASFDARLVLPTNCLFQERQLCKFLLARDLEILPGRFIAGKYRIRRVERVLQYYLHIYGSSFFLFAVS